MSLDLKKIRLKKGLSQNALAKAIGASSSMVNNWERGAFKPSAKYIPKLAEVLDIPVGDLLDAGLVPTIIDKLPKVGDIFAAKKTGELSPTNCEPTTLLSLSEKTGIPEEVILKTCVDAMAAAYDRDGELSFPMVAISKREYERLKKGAAVALPKLEGGKRHTA